MKFILNKLLQIKRISILRDMGGVLIRMGVGDNQHTHTQRGEDTLRELQLEPLEKQD